MGHYISNYRFFFELMAQHSSYLPATAKVSSVVPCVFVFSCRGRTKTQATQVKLRIKRVGLILKSKGYLHLLCPKKVKMIPSVDDRWFPIPSVLQISLTVSPFKP